MLLRRTSVSHRCGFGEDIAGKIGAIDDIRKINGYLRVCYF